MSTEAKREVWFVHWNNGPNQPFRRSGPYYDAEEAQESADGYNGFNAACEASVVCYVPAIPAPAVVTPEPTGGGEASDCPHRWMHGVMTCPHCGLAERADDADALRHELNDWRQFGFAHVGPPVTCDQDMRDGIEDQLREFARLKAEAGKAQTEGWVSVEERLPQVGALVLVVESGWTEAAIGCLHEDGVWNAEDDADSPLVVTHWRSLPAPPTSGGNK